MFSVSNKTSLSLSPPPSLVKYKQLQTKLFRVVASVIKWLKESQDRCQLVCCCFQGLGETTMQWNTSRKLNILFV